VSHKRILFRSAARERILHGATTLADAVRVTLGPKSKCVLIGRKWGPPLVCNDGVTIVKEIDLEDPEENLGAHMLREAAERTADVVGDGTTTATLLAHAILAAGLKNLAAGASAVDLKRGTGAHGFDVARGTYCDLLAAGIVDPTKVLRVAVENAVSVAGTLLLTEATLTEVEDAKPEAAALAAEP
jgi:chaperonin GroEL (HSP60 family)